MSSLSDADYINATKSRGRLMFHLSAQLRTLAGSALLFTGLSLLGTAATAQNRDLTADVVPVPDGSVSVTRDGFDSYLAYRVKIANTGPNTLNRVSFEGAILIDGVAGGGASYVPTGSSPACSAGTSTGSVKCDIGQLRSLDQTTFLVLFKMPTAGSEIRFPWSTYYAEGSNTDSGALGITTGTAVTPLITADDAGIRTRVKTYLITDGGLIFTGKFSVNVKGAAATLADPWTSSVSVPQGIPAGSTAEIFEVEGSQTLAGDLKTSNESIITIPNVTADLVITLRRDASTIATGAKIASARIYYEKLPGDTPQELLSCAVTTPYGQLPVPGRPCIDIRTEFKKSNSPTPEFIGDWQFIIKAKDNGRYIN